jgi:hypothetical protein
MARVFRIRPHGQRLYYGCVRRTGRVFRVVRVTTGVHFELPRLAGRFLAAHVWDFDAHESGVSLWDLATGQVSYWSTGEEDDFVGDDLEVTRQGAVAWVTTGDVVWKADGDGPAMIGRADPGAERGSVLVLRRETLSWIQSSQPASYTLRGPATEIG